jgi:CO dehydrogenase maturation factor
MGIVFNRVAGNEELLMRAAEDIGVEVFAMVPQDEVISGHDLVGRPLMELPAESAALAAVSGLIEQRIL